VPFKKEPVVLPEMPHPPYPERSVWAFPDEEAATMALWVFREQMRCATARVYGMTGQAVADVGEYCATEVVKEKIREVLI